MNRVGMFAAVAAVIGITGAISQVRTPSSEPCTVERVVDGDTFVCRDGTRVRLLLIDAPEADQEPYGERATAELRLLIPACTVVELETDVQHHDQYGRLLAHVHLPDTSDTVNAAMLRAGYTVVSVYAPNVRHVERYRAIADSARAARRGLWATPAFECLPVEHRRDQMPVIQPEQARAALTLVRENGAATVPEPGVYPGVPWATYHGWHACSTSRLGRLARSPAHLRAYLHGQVDDETAAKTSGRLLHSAVLEPERFRATVVRSPKGDGRTKLVRDARTALEAAGKTVIMPAEYDRIIAMRDRLLDHPTVQQLLERAFSPTELSIVWNADGLLCKARLDLPVPSVGAILDIKTARDARPSEFEKVIFNFGYARQAAHYLDGAAVHWPDTFDLFVFVVVESEPPHEVAVYELDAARSSWRGRSCTH